MENQMVWIKRFEEVGIQDIPLVGGKNASLGEMTRTLAQAGVKVPEGFAITSKAYWDILEQNHLAGALDHLAEEAEKTPKKLKIVGKAARGLMLHAQFPLELTLEIRRAYRELCAKAGDGDLAVAVRSSATAEDLPDASFAGQQETFLNVRGEKALLEACRKCYASLFTDRAIPGWATYETGTLAIILNQLIAIATSFTFFMLSNRTNLGFVPLRDYSLFVEEAVDIYSHE